MQGKMNLGSPFQGIELKFNNMKDEKNTTSVILPAKKLNRLNSIIIGADKKPITPCHRE